MLPDLAELRRKLQQPSSNGSNGGSRGAPEASGELIQAAVLVPLVVEAQGWSLVFTKRTLDLPSHPGEISFPGGSLDPGEDSLHAALREANEEMGIDSSGVDVVGKLTPAFTRASSYLIDPWVGVVKDTNFTPNPAEIAEVIIVPVKTLVDDAVKREQSFIRMGQIMSNPAYDVGPNTIWGATARILTDLLEIIF